MVDDASFAQRIRERFPEGLTGVFAAGGTRTSYLLNQNTSTQAAGAINDFAAYVDISFTELLSQIEDFYELGGQNLIIEIFSYQGFYERGETYGRLAGQMCLYVINQKCVDFYRAHDIDPYLVGIDTLLQLPEDTFEHQLGAQFAAFQREWQYQAGHRKLIMEVAPIPLFSFLRAHEVMREAAHAELEARLQQCRDLQTMHDLLYAYYSRAVYGTELPIPHFYLGNNRNGDLKLRSMFPIALLCGDPCRLYFTPYPSLLMKRETMQAILEDLAFGKRLRSTKLDYSGQITAEELQIERVRIEELVNNPESTLGLVRQSKFAGKE